MREIAGQIPAHSLIELGALKYYVHIEIVPRLHCIELEKKVDRQTSHIRKNLLLVLRLQEARIIIHEYLVVQEVNLSVNSTYRRDMFHYIIPKYFQGYLILYVRK